MFKVIQDIIDHVWVTTNAGDQQYIYYICGSLICTLSAVFIDLVYRMFTALWRGKA